MKKLIVIVFLLVCLFFLAFAAVRTVSTRLSMQGLTDLLFQDVQARERARIASERAGFELQEARLQVKKQSLVRWENARFWSVLAFLASACVSTVIVATGAYHKLSTHVLRLNTAEIPVKDKDLSRIAPEISLQLALAEQIEAQAPQRAFEMYCQISELNTRQISALVGRRGLLSGNQTVNITGAEPAALPASTSIPSFRSLLDQDVIAPGKPLLVGYTQDGQPCRSDLEDNYSKVVIGQSGTGKTTGEVYDVAQTIIAYNAYYTILDPHFPDKKKESLGDRLGTLRSLPNIRIFNNPLELDVITEQLDHEFEAYKASGQGHVPHIIVVDEHSLWKNSSTGGKEFLRFEEKIIYEGRKYDWYLHVTSKSALAQDFGTSAVRDNFVTSLLYKTKKGQAQTYFKDSELAELSQQCTKPGMAVYTDRANHSQIVQIPMIQQEDMQAVIKYVGNGEPIQIPPRKCVSEETHIDMSETPSEREETPETPFLMNVQKLRRIVTTWIETEKETLSGLAKKIDMNKGQVYRFVKENDTPSETLRLALSKYVSEQITPKERGETPSNVVPFPKK